MLVRRLGSRAALGLRRRNFRALHAAVLVVDEAFVVARRRHALVGRAALERNEVVVATIVSVGCDQIAVLAAWRDAVAIDLAGETRIDREDRLAQRLALDEVVGQLIERAIIVVVDPRIALEHADQDFALDLVVTIVGKAGALADQDALGARDRNELVGNRARL